MCAVRGLSSLLVFALAFGCDTPSGDGCAAPAAMCVSDVLGPIPGQLAGSTVDASDDFGGSDCGDGGDGVPDVAYAFVAPEAGIYRFETVGSDFDTMLSIRESCGGAELACNDDIARGNVQSRVEVTLAACQEVTVVVDGFSPREVGEVRLAVSGRETACDDGEDNDGDGAADCADPDCFSLECSGGDDWPEDWAAFEWGVLEHTNAARASGATCETDVFGPAPPLEMDMVIREASRGHSLDMGQQDYFEHQSLDGREFDDRMRAVGFSGAGPWGENIAAGSRTAAEVVDGWMRSPGHCRNIMNPDYRVIGIGYAFVETSTFGEYWTQNFAGSH